MFYNEPVGFKICLYGYDKFFKQFVGCWVYSNLKNIIRVWYDASTFNINLYVCETHFGIISMKKLPLNFYKRKDVVAIARELLGKIVVTNFDGIKTSGRIVEAEAYVAHVDKASHAFGGRRTAKNEHMYAHPGTAYVYICYGMHQMFNIVTNEKDIPDAVLIRGIEPLEGIDMMLKRTGKPSLDFTLTKGPGNVGKALGIFKKHSGLHLLHDEKNDA